MEQLLTVSLRQKAIFIPRAVMKVDVTKVSPTTAMLVANLAKLGYGVSEPLLKALGEAPPAFQLNVLDKFREVMGVNKNWTPLVKGWDMPTGESYTDHVITFFVNLFKAKGTKLPCGHIIPADTFPLHRYNGCPFCGTPFEQGRLENYKQGSTQKILELWTEEEAQSFLADLISSKTALDATQMDSLKVLLSVFPVPLAVKPGMKETLVALVDVLIEQGQEAKAQTLFNTPVDIMRYLWYKQTGFLQLIEPKTILKRQAKNKKHVLYTGKPNAKDMLKEKAALKLKYTRKQCLMVAGWLNSLPMEPVAICESMHPKRAMWVRFIRGLRLAEYSHRKGFEKLAEVLDRFYNERYDVWQGYVDHYRLRYDPESTFALLQDRPGLFARSLFANMLWFGAAPAIEAFSAVVHKVPARLIYTLAMYADVYFDKNNARMVKPLGGVAKSVPANGLLELYSQEQLEEMKAAVSDLCLLVAKRRFAAQPTKNKTIYIDPVLFKMPIAIGDRSETVQDIPAALAGTRFPVVGNKVRLFMQWGTGLKAQPLDMDLSCVITYSNKYEDRCSFSQLVTTGCKHSGDIRSIPEKTGTAEYIEITIDELQKAKATYVVFTSNAYSTGAITPNLVVGWMESQYPMRISETTGVAYDPSCVQHQVRVVNKLTKGLVFGVLDVQAYEIIWLEMPFDGQLAQHMNTDTIKALLKKLENKLSIGQLLTIKAEAQQLERVFAAEKADEVYTQIWAGNAAAVTKLLVE